jgi:DNA helicase-2/ATP-dependent DNA helicase PcrA
VSYESRFKKLNEAQQTAVTTIEGPLMVVAGPGTGKTELLSMRAANILRSTDTLPENILCLTFTESGAHAMRQRLLEIIGPDAYKISVQTFHSFGTEIIRKHAEFFYNGATFQPASDVSLYEMVRGIFDELPHDNVLSSSMNGEYTYQRDTMQVISEIKRSGFTSDELLQILRNNERILDITERAMQELFAQRISKSTIDALEALAMTIAQVQDEPLPAAVTPLTAVLAVSLSRAIDEAHANKDSTKPITAWRNTWFEKNGEGDFVYKDRSRIKKLRSVAFIYQQYTQLMQSASLYDFDDMILNVVHALEVHPDLRANLQEQYLYIMVDEFQDTNLAQNRLLRSLADSPIYEGAPNIMVVGDDDQAIYSFQGAEISNILQFKNSYESVQLITLTENYRSTNEVLKHSRSIITQGTDRLESYYPELNKSLHANRNNNDSRVALYETSSQADERNWIAKDIQQKIDSGVAAHEIVVLARRHHELVSLLQYFNDLGIEVNYERRENILDNEIIRHIELLARIIIAIASKQHDEADALLPELLSHPAWHISPTELWKLSLAAYRDKVTWMEYLESHPSHKQLHTWLCELAALSLHAPLEHMLDILIGTAEAGEYTSPLYAFYFSEQALETSPELYLRLLGSFRSIRDRLRDHSATNELKLSDMVAYIDLQRSLGTVIVDVTSRSHSSDHKINLMTAHKSKGLEFDHVYIIGAADSAWGEKVRTRSRLISYPENLPLAPAGDSYDERLRLFYVAMTRARNNLSISYSMAADTTAPLLPARFLAGTIDPTPISTVDNSGQQIAEARRDWYIEQTAKTPVGLRDLLAPTLESYKLSATHLNTFLDVTRGGPQFFLVQNLLRFPQAMSPNAAYGSAVHKTLQLAHSHLSATGVKKPVEDLINEFEKSLKSSGLLEKDYETFSKRGADYLQQFFDQTYDSFTTAQRAELNFSSQHSMLDSAHLTGSLDLVEIDTSAKTIVVTDYKTGKPSTSWNGNTDAEKVKLHKYRQQLMFYKLLVEHSRDYGRYTVNEANLQYVEPTKEGRITSLSLVFEPEELERFSRLVTAVWESIVSFSLPDISAYPQSYKGILAFEEDLLDSIDK